MWTMYGEPISEPYCPFCGFNSSIHPTEGSQEDLDEKTTELLVKKESVTLAEDRITEQRCTEGGWWNPITKECMGEGKGFIPRNT